MLEHGKISGLQMAFLIYLTIIATAILLVPAITGTLADQDMWLSPIWGAIPGFYTFFIIYKLQQIYPNDTIIQFTEKIIGKYFGKLLNIFMLFFFWFTGGIAYREYGEFVSGNFLPTTPMVIITAGIALISAAAVHGGLEVLARCAQLFVPVILLLFLLILILLTPDLDPGNILPIMENGPVPSLKGAIITANWFNQIIFVSFMFPFLKKNVKKGKWGIITILAVMFMLVLTNMFALFLFGDITSSFTYPVMNAARYISVADFLQHVESVVMAIWVLAVFIKLSVFLYVISIGTAQLFQLSDYKPIVYPITLSLIAGSAWSIANLEELTKMLSTTWPFWAIIMFMIIPTFLYSIALIQKRLKKNNK